MEHGRWRHSHNVGSLSSHSIHPFLLLTERGEILLQRHARLPDFENANTIISSLISCFDERLAEVRRFDSFLPISGTFSTQFADGIPQATMNITFYRQPMSTTTHSQTPTANST